MRAHRGGGIAGVPYGYFGRSSAGHRLSASEAFRGHRGEEAEKREESFSCCTESAVRPH